MPANDVKEGSNLVPIIAVAACLCSWVGSCQSLIEELCTPELTVALDIEMTSRIGRVRRTSCGFDLAESTVSQCLCSK